MISIKTPEEIQKMRDAGQILAQVFEEIEANFKLGVSAKLLDDIARETILKFGAKPSFLGYQGYQYSTCISKNEEVVHGIPHEDKLMLPGDFCSIDIGVFFNGFHADAARIFTVDPIDEEAQQLIRVTKECFEKGIAQAKEGNRLGDISHAIQSHAEAHGYGVVRDLCSHGIGRTLHEEPLLPNYGKPGKGPVLKAGMTFAIEPMINLGTYDVLTLSDKWTIISADRKISAHYENTICVGIDGPEILTIRN